MFRKLISPAARSIAESFRTGRLEHCDINGHGISEMSVGWHGHTISLSWYAGRKPRLLRIDNNSGFPVGADSLYIFHAAWERSDQITSEMVASLNTEALEEASYDRKTSVWLP